MMILKKKGLLRVVIITILSFSSPFLFAQGHEGLKMRHGMGGPATRGGEKAPVFPTMAKPGQQVSLPNGGYFIYGFDKKPKMGMAVVKVEIFNKEGKKDTSFQVKGEAGMPSMGGAHETGDQPFTLSKKGDYLLPINLVMPGDWEIRLTFSKEGKVIFRGSHQFDV
jgi:hypothetical protein